jgi:hypothetical protein
MCIYIKRLFKRKFWDKILWASNNFLTMQFYRKLCNRLYWKKLQPGTLPYTTRCWLIFITVISVIWLAFFFDPMDPDYSKSPSSIISRLNRFYKKIEYFIFDLFHTHYLYSQFNLNILSPPPISNNIFLWRNRKTYIRTSSILI